MRFLAIDVGDKRTGLAVGDDELRMAQPVCVLEIPIGKQLVDAVINAINEHDIDELVIGLPLHMDGSTGQRVDVTKQFASQLAKENAIPIPASEVVFLGSLPVNKPPKHTTVFGSESSISQYL